MGLPVSTTHVLSGVGDTMTANHSGLQRDSVRSLLTACVLTPASPRGSGGVPGLAVRTDDVNAGRPLGSTIHREVDAHSEAWGLPRGPFRRGVSFIH